MPLAVDEKYITPQGLFCGAGLYFGQVDPAPGKLPQRLVQQAGRTQRGEYSFIEMGGRGEVKDQDHLVQEVAIRGFWQYYRKVMQFRGDRGNGQ